MEARITISDVGGGKIRTKVQPIRGSFGDPAAGVPPTPVEAITASILYFIQNLEHQVKTQVAGQKADGGGNGKKA